MPQLPTEAAKRSNVVVYIDLETTGQFPSMDRIVELSVIREEIEWCQSSTRWVTKAGATRSLTMRFNPGVPIPPEATAVHGITDEDVKNEPLFESKARALLRFLPPDGLYIGYNLIRFDLPVLAAEFRRAGAIWDYCEGSVVDVMKLYFQFNPRNLQAAYAHYIGGEISGAHSAKADVEATKAVLLAQIEAHDLPRDFFALAQRIREGERAGGEYVDAERKFVWRFGEPVFAFSKLAGVSLREAARTERSFLEWMLRADFTEEVKILVCDALQGRYRSREAKEGA